MGTDVRVVETGGGLGLQAEAGHVQGCGQFSFEDHLEGDDAIERGLPRLVDHAHAATGDLFQQLVVAKVADTHRVAGRFGVAHGAVRVVGQAQVGGLSVEAVVIGEEGAEALGQVGVASQQGFAVGDGAGLHLLQVVRQDGIERIVLGRGGLFGGAHGFTPKATTDVAELPGRAATARRPRGPSGRGVRRSAGASGRGNA